jgi:ATP-dependent exoDNAse (exonuclease V) alpha subunit
VIPPTFREFSHGYATTSHAAQGKTVDHGILLMGEAGIAAANLKQAYVSNSRFRESQTIYTTDRREARAAMMTPGDRKLAREMNPGFEQAAAVAAAIPTPRPTVGPRI